MPGALRLAEKLGVAYGLVVLTLSLMGLLPIDDGPLAVAVRRSPATPP